MLQTKVLFQLYKCMTLTSTIYSCIVGTPLQQGYYKSNMAVECSHFRHLCSDDKVSNFKLVTENSFKSQLRSHRKKKKIP